MKILPYLVVASIVAHAVAETPAPPAPAPTPSPTPVQNVIDVLSDAQLDQAIQSLRTNFLDSSRTSDRDLRRATLEGLIKRLQPGVSVMEETSAKPEPAPAFLAEILDARIGYVRPGEMSQETLPQLDAALANFKEKSIKAVILDLRGQPASSNFELAAAYAKRFAPRGKVLFSIEKPSAKQERIFTSDQDPSFTGIVVVLTDQQNAGSAEALAATLRENANAMIVGATTRGQAVEFSDVPLGDGKLLRVAVAQVTLPGAKSIFPAGVKPDIAAALDEAAQRRIFAQSKEKGVSQFVFETERPQLNEAALVANTNPEIDPANLRRDRDVLWDTVLQRAVDLVTAISFYHDRGPSS